MFIGNKIAIGMPIMGAAAPAWSNAYSLLLDGVDEYVNIDAVQTALASTTVGTWSARVKMVDATPTGTQMIMSLGDTNASEWLSLHIAGGGTSGLLTAQCRVAGVNKWILQTDAVALSDATWAHVALVQNGTSSILYVEDVAVAQTFTIITDKTVWVNGMAGIDNGRIGAFSQNSSTSGYFSGNVDEVLFINRALTAPQISDIYNGGIPKDESGLANLISYFRIDGDTVPTMTDTTGSNNGTYVNVEQADIELDVP